MKSLVFEPFGPIKCQFHIFSLNCALWTSAQQCRCQKVASEGVLWFLKLCLDPSFTLYLGPEVIQGISSWKIGRGSFLIKIPKDQKHSEEEQQKKTTAAAEDTGLVNIRLAKGLLGYYEY